MAVNWGLAGPGFNALESLQVAGQAQLRAQQERARALELEQAQRRQAVGQQAGGLAAGGDYAGARAAALNAGEFDIANHVSGLEENHRKDLDSRAATIGALAVSLKGVPQEQRAARLQAVAPQLAERGIPADMLAQADLSDTGLDGYISFATSAKDAIGAYNKSQEAYTLGDGQERYVGVTMIAQNAKEAPKPHYIFDSESGSWLLEPGTGGAAASSLPQPGYAGGSRAAGGGGAGVPRNVRNNNPGNIEDGAFARSQPGYKGGDGRFAVFENSDAGSGAQAALLGSYMNRGFNTVQKIINRWAPPSDGNDTSTYVRNVAKALNVNPGDTLTPAAIPRLQAAIARQEGRPGPSSGISVQAPSVQATAQNGSVVNVRAPKSRNENAPSGYRYNGSSLEPIPGGPADPNTSTQRNVQSNRTAEANFRKEFDALPEVKSFKTARQQFNTLRDLGTKKNPTPQDDIALIFSYMKTLDPSSVVREGEFAQAQNAGSVPDNIRNAYNKALEGTRLSPQQRQSMVRTAYQNYSNYRDAYNQAAENYRGYAKDNGISPDRVARTYTPDKPKASGFRAGETRTVGRLKIRALN